MKKPSCCYTASTEVLFEISILSHRVTFDENSLIADCENSYLHPPNALESIQESKLPDNTVNIVIFQQVKADFSLKASYIFQWWWWRWGWWHNSKIQHRTNFANIFVHLKFFIRSAYFYMCLWFFLHFVEFLYIKKNNRYDRCRN